MVFRDFPVFSVAFLKNICYNSLQCSVRLSAAQRLRRVGISVLQRLPKPLRRVRLPYPAPAQKFPLPLRFPPSGRKAAPDGEFLRFWPRLAPLDSGPGGGPGSFGGAVAPYEMPGQRLAKRKARKKKGRPSVNHPTASAQDPKRGPRVLHLSSPARAGRGFQVSTQTGRGQPPYIGKLDRRSSLPPASFSLFPARGTRHL